MADLFDTNSTWNVLEKSMDISADRHRLITNNIANIDTIGYEAKDLNFKEALEEALKVRSNDLIQTHPKHIRPVPVSGALRVKKTADRLDSVAPVDIDQEMTHLVQNNIQYRTSVEMLLRKMNMLKHTIAEAGR
jgi:flagellar basal-body rod protein FlgB